MRNKDKKTITSFFKRIQPIASTSRYQQDQDPRNYALDCYHLWKEEEHQEQLLVTEIMTKATLVLLLDTLEPKDFRRPTPQQ